MKKIVFIVLIALVICISLTACKVTDKAEQPAEMQMVYEDNPALFFKDIKLIWDEKNYYPSNMLNAGRGKEIGYAADEYNGWRLSGCDMCVNNERKDYCHEKIIHNK